MDDRRLWFLAGPRLTPAAWVRPPQLAGGLTATSASAPPCLVVQAVERGAAAPAPHQER